MKNIIRKVYVSVIFLCVPIVFSHPSLACSDKDMVKANLLMEKSQQNGVRLVNSCMKYPNPSACIFESSHGLVMELQPDFATLPKSCRTYLASYIRALSYQQKLSKVQLSQVCIESSCF